MRIRPAAIAAILFPMTTLAVADDRPMAWEYAILTVHPQLGANWQTPENAGVDGLLAADKLPSEPELYAKLGGTKPQDKQSRLDLLNQIGKQGWELVSAKDNTQYIFKRPAKKA